MGLLVEPKTDLDKASPLRNGTTSGTNGITADSLDSTVDALAAIDHEAPEDKQYADPNGADDSGDDDDEDTRLVQNAPSKPRKISEKKRQEAIGLDNWYGANGMGMTNKAAGQSDNDFFKSTAFLVKGMEGDKIITSPRDYQVELFERAKERNTIAVLDTGE